MRLVSGITAVEMVSERSFTSRSSLMRVLRTSLWKISPNTCAICLVTVREAVAVEFLALIANVAEDWYWGL